MVAQQSLRIKLNGRNYEVKKSIYTNGRLKLFLVNDKLIDLSRNIESAIFANEMFNEVTGRELFVNHIDGFLYEDLLDELELSDLFELNRWEQLDIQGNVKNGFNTYIGIEIKEKVLDKIENY
ncbi:hypothetical protein BUY43_07605 [Staphylococcus devriesei]|uniref:Uncharacterized protein n=1 Tax=Staphylococcus devriesei TaxID=586733 RepID=A0A2T4KH53_9STAP|nr:MULTISPECIES: hypothetical protein [Staphylococcus]PTE73223.1 hypothetical protein BUY44_06765 [Staphylococcus devriesei]PTF12561.1 hypothetical protein BUY47_11475 [Staphylococcus devriesei]PTF17955.1 hypothetical protein BUY42_08255 [Staphylococcus devriesei]PTG36078.1 hypothetical protein BU624_10140 [Staphylococcus capitis]PTK20890.1 hypothetical protein BUZ52_09550 [Staphylococcus hominis]